MNSTPQINDAFDDVRNQASHDKFRQQALKATFDAERINSDLLEEGQLARSVKAPQLSKDQEKRHQAIANSIKEGINNGTIDPAKTYEYPEFNDWLDKRKELRETQNDLKTAAEQTQDLEGLEMRLLILMLNKVRFAH